MSSTEWYCQMTRANIDIQNVCMYNYYLRCDFCKQSGWKLAITIEEGFVHLIPRKRRKFPFKEERFVLELELIVQFMQQRLVLRYNLRCQVADLEHDVTYPFFHSISARALQTINRMREAARQWRNLTLKKSLQKNFSEQLVPGQFYYFFVRIQHNTR